MADSGLVWLLRLDPNVGPGGCHLHLVHVHPDISGLDLVHVGSIPLGVPFAFGACTWDQGSVNTGVFMAVYPQSDGMAGSTERVGLTYYNTCVMVVCWSCTQGGWVAGNQCHPVSPGAFGADVT